MDDECKECGWPLDMCICDEDEGWTDDEEEELLSWGICPECGGKLDICGHGDPALDAHWGDDDE